MAKVVYKIVKHENGWAYKARGTFSETFPSHDAALAAARTAAGEQKVPGETVGIEYETADGIWHEELDPARTGLRPGSRTTETAILSLRKGGRSSRPAAPCRTQTVMGNTTPGRRSRSHGAPSDRDDSC